MQTLKLPYKTQEKNKDVILTYQQQYSSCLHFMYNRIKDNISETLIKHLSINHIDLLDSWFKQSCVKEALQLHSTFKSKDKKLIFGGKFNFIQRCKNKITKKEYDAKRLAALYSIGENYNPCVKGNRKFHIEQNLKSISFKPKRNISIQLDLPKLHRNYLDIFSKLYILQQNASLSISYKLDQNHIYISFDESKLAETKLFKPIDNRILALDLNPNYVGWSVVDWASEANYSIVEKGVYSIKQINDKEHSFKELKLDSSDLKRIALNNKRRFEILEVSKSIINIAKQLRVELVAIEDLNMKSSDKGKSKNFNKLCNNLWLRNTLVNNLTKRCNLEHIKLQKVNAAYSSFVGNILYRNNNLPDMVLSSIEISRRAYEFNLQYIKKIKPKKKNIILPDICFYKDLLIKSLEEFDLKIENRSLIDLYYFFKNSKIKYRVSLDDIKSRVFSMKCIKSKVNCYQFI